MPNVDVVVIGASAGGLQALLDIVADLPPSLPAAILVVVHTPTMSTQLPAILARETKLAVQYAEDNAEVLPGRVYVAPPDVHLLVTRSGLTLNHGPRENGFRPAIDPLFRSAAEAYGARVMGVVLSGALDDGTDGLALIKDAGGVTVVQDPDEALIPAMPISAMNYLEVDHVLTAARIGELIVSSSESTFNGVPVMARNNADEPLERAMTVDDMTDRFGSPSALTCPDCGGALWEVKKGKLSRYRCHVGHQYSLEALDAGQRDVVEEALWTAVRALEEHADLRSRLSRRAGMAGLDRVSGGFADSARVAHRQAQSIRDLLTTEAPDVPAKRTASPPPRRRLAAPKRKQGRTRA